jgi:hypothetical protein
METMKRELAEKKAAKIQAEKFRLWTELQDISSEDEIPKAKKPAKKPAPKPVKKPKPQKPQSDSESEEEEEPKIYRPVIQYF